MPKAWTGLTSTDVNDYEALESRAFSGPSYTTALTATDETFTVTDTLAHSLRHIPRGNLTVSTNLAIRTAAGGGGTLLTCTTTTGALTSGQVRVRQRSGKLEFHADQEGVTLYATYTYRISNFDESLFAQVYNRLRTVETQTGVAAETYNAGEDVVAGPGYISGGLVYQADPSALTTCGSCWILADTSSGNPATIYRTGNVTPRRNPPANTPIYVGHGGDITWESDTEESAKLQTDEYWQPIGKSDDGVTLNLNTNQDVRRQ